MVSTVTDANPARAPDGGDARRGPPRVSQMPTQVCEPSANPSRFQIGTSLLRVSISARQASNAAARCAAETTTTTAASPTFSGPTRCSAARAITSWSAATFSATSRSSLAASGWASYSRAVTTAPGASGVWSRTVPRKTAVPPAAGSATIASSSSTDNGEVRICVWMLLTSSIIPYPAPDAGRAALRRGTRSRSDRPSGAALLPGPAHQGGRADQGDGGAGRAERGGGVLLAEPAGERGVVAGHLVQQGLEGLDVRVLRYEAGLLQPLGGHRPRVHDVLQVGGRRRRQVQPVQPLGGAQRQAGRQLHPPQSGAGLHLLLAQPA